MQRLVLAAVVACALSAQAFGQDAVFDQARAEAEARLSLAARARARVAYEEAVASGRFMVIAVGCERPDLETGDWFACRKERGFADLEHGIIVAKDGFVQRTLPCGTSAEEIRRAIEAIRGAPRRDARPPEPVYAPPVWAPAARHTYLDCLPPGH